MENIFLFEICQKLSSQIFEAILFFHVFTGSELTSSLNNKGKKKAWNIWNGDNVLLDTMTELTQKSPHVQGRFCSYETA